MTEKKKKRKTVGGGAGIESLIVSVMVDSWCTSPKSITLKPQTTAVSHSVDF